MHFSTVNNISISVKLFTFSLDFFKVGCHADAGAERNQAESSRIKLIYLKTHISQVLKNIS